MRFVITLTIALFCINGSASAQRRFTSGGCANGQCGVQQGCPGGVCSVGSANIAEEWKPIPGTNQMAHYRNGVQVGAKQGAIYRIYDAKTNTWGPIPTPTIKPAETETIKPAKAISQAADDEVGPLAQVNARRVASGLRPYIFDRGLFAAARAAAQHRAAHRIAAHTANDFIFLPSGVQADAAGCNIATPGGPEFMTCAMYEPNCTHAGAATVVTPDGYYYHHLFVR